VIALVFTNREYLLVSLGLTSSQARVYMTLVRNGPSRVAAISQSSGIHRAHLYEILQSLEKMGFIEKNLEEGTYRPAPLKESALVLVKHRQQEMSKLETEINAIVESLPEPTQSLDAKPEILLVSNKNRTLSLGQKSLESAKSTIDLMHSWTRFSQLWQFYDATFVSVMSRGISIRQIVETPKCTIHVQRFLNKKIFKNKLLKLRFVPETGGNFSVIDNNRLLLSTTTSHESLGESPFIFSNCEGLVGLLRNYFELSWKSSLTLSQLSFE
jgi:sugar-specific transcriptional regulator TrmB